MEDNYNKDDIDSIMRSSYISLTSNIEDTIREFIVFSKKGDLIEINGSVEEKCEFLNEIIKYFENIEEFEKCQKLLDLKTIIIENENKNKN
jgi:hypothetical protein